jgi:hypothetical protein
LNGKTTFFTIVNGVSPEAFYEIKNPSFVTMNVYNIPWTESAGFGKWGNTCRLHYVNYDAGSLSSGIYFYELNVEWKSLVKKINLLHTLVFN